MKLKAPGFATQLEILKEGRQEGLIPAPITYLQSLKERNTAHCRDQFSFLWSLWKGAQVDQATPQGESMDCVDKKPLDFLTTQWSSKYQGECQLGSSEYGKFNGGEKERPGRIMAQPSNI